MLENCSIDNGILTCVRCNIPISLKRKGVFVGFCKCFLFRLVRCRNHIDISNMSNNQSLKVQYSEI